MENPYEAPGIVETAKPRGAPLLGLLFFLLAGFNAIGGIANFVVPLLTKLGFFPNTRFRSSLWPIAVESAIIVGVAVLSIVTGISFIRGRFKLAGVLACVTLLSFVYTIYWL